MGAAPERVGAAGGAESKFEAGRMRASRVVIPQFLARPSDFAVIYGMPLYTVVTASWLLADGPATKVGFYRM